MIHWCGLSMHRGYRHHRFSVLSLAASPHCSESRPQHYCRLLERLGLDVGLGYETTASRAAHAAATAGGDAGGDAGSGGGNSATASSVMGL